MKHSSKIKKQVAQPQSPKAAAARYSPMRWVVLGLTMLLVAGGTWGFMEFIIWNKLPAELVGKWVVTEGPDEGGTIDFYRDGTMRAVVNLQGKTGIVDAVVRVEDKKIYATLTNQFTGGKGTRVQTITVLTRDRLILEDERGNSIKLRRAD
jgi:uncharacterized protein (TIGR03066 family)